MYKIFNSSIGFFLIVLTFVLIYQFGSISNTISIIFLLFESYEAINEITDKIYTDGDDSIELNDFFHSIHYYQDMVSTKKNFQWNLQDERLSFYNIYIHQWLVYISP